MQSLSELRISRNAFQNVRSYISSHLNDEDSIINVIRNALYANVFSVNYSDVDDGLSLLHIFVLCRKVNIIRILFNEFNASKNVRCINGLTAFAYACQYGFIYIVRLFVNDNIYDYTSYINLQDNQGYTPLLLSLKYNNYGVAKFLYNICGADTMVISNDGFYITPELLNRISRRARPINLIERERQQIRYGDITANEARIILEQSFPQINTELVPVYDVETQYTSYVNIPSITLPIQFERQTAYESEPVSIENASVPPTYIVEEHIKMLIELGKECPICYEKFQENKVMLLKNCWHSLCTDCCNKITDNRCHMCRKNIV